MHSVNLILPGGAAKGVIQAGMIKAINESFRIASVTGTSIGALNSAYVAHKRIDLLEDLAKGGTDGLIKREILGIYNVNGLFDRIKRDLKNEFITMPFGVTYTSLTTRSVLYWIHGSKSSKDVSMFSALRASSALVPFMSSIRIRQDGIDHVAIDGGFTEGVPGELSSVIGDPNSMNIVLSCDTSGTGKHGWNMDLRSPSKYEIAERFTEAMNAINTAVMTLYDSNVKVAKQHWGNNYYIVPPPMMTLPDGLILDSRAASAYFDIGYAHAGSHVESIINKIVSNKSC
jgi:predicted acylesterase/phospholipase RssA